MGNVLRTGVGCELLLQAASCLEMQRYGVELDANRLRIVQCGIITADEMGAIAKKVKEMIDNTGGDSRVRDYENGYLRRDYDCVATIEFVCEAAKKAGMFS
jgi:hypothetical protein